MGISVLVLILFLLLSFLFSGTEAALFSVLEIEVEKITGPRIKKWVRKLLSKQEESLFVILLGNMLVNSYASAIFPSILIGIFGNVHVSKSLESGLEIILFTFILLLFGEITPKLIAIDFPSNFLKKSVGIFYPLYVILKPFTKPFTLVLEWISALSRRTYEQEEVLKNLEEMTLGSRSGLRSGISLVMYTAEEIMTPRKDIVFMNASMNIAEARSRAKLYGFTRYPVRGESQDDIRGVFEIDNPELINAKDEEDILKYTKEADFIPSGRKVTELVKMAVGKNRKMFIVVDEYGGVKGIVTLGDLLKILGVKKEKRIKRIDVHTFVIPGDYLLGELEALLQKSISSEATTIQGLLMEITGRLPEEGEKVLMEDVEFEILEKDRGEIKRVKVKVL